METSEVFKNQSFQNPLFSSYLSNSVPPLPPFENSKTRIAILQSNQRL